MGLELGQTRIKQHLPTMLRPLVREYTDSSGNEGKEDRFLPKVNEPITLSVNDF